MRAYVIRRLLIAIPTLLLASLLVFFVIQLLPGDITDVILASPSVEQIDIASIKRKFGLDAPPIVQYARWLGVLPGPEGRHAGLLQGDFGVSWWRQVPVTRLLAGRWPVTLELGLMALIVAQLIALPTGVLSALRQDTWADYVARGTAIFCIAVPSFWLGTMVIVFPSIWWGYTPPIGLVRFSQDPWRNLQMFIVPAVVTGMELSGITMRLTRTMMLEVLRQDYVRTAWAKGLKQRVIVSRHALKNALIPVVTIVGMQLPIMVGGTVIVEQIFSLPGMGRLIIDATLQRDEPLLRAEVLLIAVVLVLTNLVVDLSYAYLDPRIRAG